MLIRRSWLGGFFQAFPLRFPSLGVGPAICHRHSKKAWFAFACDESEMKVVQELAELLMQMLKSCKRQTPPPRLRVALKVAAEKLEDIQEAKHDFAEAVLKEVKAGGASSKIFGAPPK